MNWIYFHLLINHFPVVLAGVALLTMLFGSLIGRRQAWLYTAITLTLAGVFAYPTAESGERASKIFRDRMPSAREHIESHEEAARLTLWILLGSGVLGIVSWYRIGSDEPTMPVPGWVKVALTVPALASAGAVGVTSYRGGHIGHQPWETSFRAPRVISADSMIRIKASQQPMVPSAIPIDSVVRKDSTVPAKPPPT
ncbi:MAG TPA: hypothetical protein VM053_08850 [Gemmatimonadaceae bacterium]|nr:hypothetical protein [Gemmatimonadaceae bacterium]